MAANPAYIPIEMYLNGFSDYEPDAEYVDGFIEERPMGQWDHSSWQLAIQLWFAAHAAEWQVRIRPELRIRVARTRVRIPDVAIVDRGQPVEQVPTYPPLAVFEVLSPDDVVSRVLPRLADFAAMGVPHIWVIDPETELYYRYVDGVPQPATYFGAPGDRVHFAIAEIKAFLD